MQLPAHLKIGAVTAATGARLAAAASYRMTDRYVSTALMPASAPA